MKNPFAEDNGNISITRISLIINSLAGIGLAFYSVYKGQVNWPLVGLVGTMIGVTNVAKVIQKKMENSK